MKVIFLDIDGVLNGIEFQKSCIDIYDITPVLGRKRDEISAWLVAHPNTESYVILDDAEGGWGDLLPFLVITDPLNSRGLEYEHIEKALKILNN